MGWFKRHKFLTAIIAVVVLVAIAGAGSGGNDTGNSGQNGSGTTKSDSNDDSGEKKFRFADRADKQESDVEVLVKEEANIDGMKMTVTKAEYKTSVSDFESAGSGKTYLVATVALENSSDRTKPYNVFDFRVQTSGGQVLDGAFATVADPLNSGDLVAGGKVQGQVIFEVPVEKGHQYIIWKPEAFSSDRAIVRVK